MEIKSKTNSPHERKKLLKKYALTRKSLFNKCEQSHEIIQDNIEFIDHWQRQRPGSDVFSFVQTNESSGLYCKQCIYVQT